MNPIRRTRHFLAETTTELRKSIWPTWKELRDSTVVVLVATALLGGYCALSDFAVYNWIQLITQAIR